VHSVPSACSWTAASDISVTRASAKQENRLYAAPRQLLRSVCPSMMYNNPR
jgi:hypothetical protein